MRLAQLTCLRLSCLPHMSFAVVEFDGVGVARLGDGIDGGALREIGEDRVDGGGAEVADVSDGRAVGAEGVGHDGAVAAELDHLGDELEIRAEAGGGSRCASAKSPIFARRVNLAADSRLSTTWRMVSRKPSKPTRTLDFLRRARAPVSSSKT